MTASNSFSVSIIYDPFSSSATIEDFSNAKVSQAVEFHLHLPASMTNVNPQSYCLLIRCVPWNKTNTFTNPFSGIGAISKLEFTKPTDKPYLLATTTLCLTSITGSDEQNWSLNLYICDFSNNIPVIAHCRPINLSTTDEPCIPSFKVTPA